MDAGVTVDLFCKQEVEPVGKECEQLQVRRPESAQIQTLLPDVVHFRYSHARLLVSRHMGTAAFDMANITCRSAALQSSKLCGECAQ